MKKMSLFVLSVIVAVFFCVAIFSACEEEKTEHVHALVERSVTEATCCAEGNIAHWYCEGCGKYFSDAEGKKEISSTSVIVAKLPHTYEENASDEYLKTAATCTGSAVYYKSCTGCGQRGEETFVHGGFGAHSLYPVAEIPATCADDGINEYYVCEVCQKKFSDENALDEIENDDELIIPATREHLPVHHAEVPSTCNSKGTNEYWSCENCDLLFADAECRTSIDWDSIKKTEYGQHILAFSEERPGTCTAAGVAAHYYCTHCLTKFRDGDGTQPVFSDSELATPPDPARHSSEFVRGYASTCTVAGMRDYWACNDCGKMFYDEQCTEELYFSDMHLPLAAHSLTHHERVEPNCVKSGQIEYWECSECFSCFSDEQCQYPVYNIFLPQDWQRHEKLEHFDRTEPTCIADGTDEHYICSDCGGCFDRNMTPTSLSLLTLPHGTAYHFTEFIEQREASCLTGIRMDCYRCRHCGGYFSDASAYIGSELGASEVEIPATGIHTVGHIEAVPPSCSAPGNIEYWNCSICGKLFADEDCTQILTESEILLKQLPHEIEYRQETESTCSVHGYSAHYLCLNCGTVFSDEAGSEEISEESVIKPLKQHPYSEEWTYNANGHWHPVTCGCAGVTVGYESHRYQAIYTDVPACEFVGELTFVCEVCGHKRTQIVSTPIASHNFVLHEEIPATCLEEGLSAYYFCTSCKHNYVMDTDGNYVRGEPSVIPAAGHEYAWTTEIAASCKGEGLDRGVCVNCGDVTTRITPKLEHTLGQEYECNSVAHWNVCTTCGEAVTEWEIHSALSGSGYCRYCNTDLKHYSGDIEYTDPTVFTYNLLADGTYEITGIDPSFSGELVINGIYNGKFVTSLSDTALQGNTSITGITFPASFTYIGDCSGCTSLTYVSFEKTIRIDTIISFAESRITRITVPDSVKIIGEYAFYNCPIESFSFPEGLECVEAYAFARQKQSAKPNELTLSVPDSCTYIGDHAFEYVPLTSLDLGKGVRHIGTAAFGHTFIERLSLPDSLTYLGERAFEYSTLIREIRFGTGLKDISRRAFAYAGSIDNNIELDWLDSGIVSIGEEAFYGIGWVSTAGGEYDAVIYIPASVTDIGARAFGSSEWVSYLLFDVQFTEPKGWQAGDIEISNANEYVYSDLIDSNWRIYFEYCESAWKRQND